MNHKKQKDSDFMKLLFTITIPIALQNFISFMVNMVDTVMLGALGETQLSASSLANQPFFIFTIITFGLAGASTVLCSQYWGKKDLVAIRQIISIVIRIAIIIALVFSFIVLVFPENVMQLYTNEPKIIEEGSSYLRIIGIGYVFYAITNTFLCSIRSLEIVKISVVVNLITLILNLFFNWVLIFGNLGFPELGIRGAAIATVISRVVEFIIVIIFAFKIDKILQIKINYFLTINISMLKSLFKHSSSVVMNEVIWSIGVSIQSMIFGKIGVEAVAAHSITSVVQQLSTVVVFGIASAASVLVGKAIGEGNIAMAKQRSSKLTILSIGVGVAAFTLILSFRDTFIQFYNISDSTMVLAKEMMAMASVIIFFTSISAIHMIGILRGAADTKFALTAEIISLWVVALPLALLGAFVLKLPVPIIYGLMKTDELIKAILCFIRTRGTKWIKDVTVREPTG